jgi:hypothetical protein
MNKTDCLKNRWSLGSIGQAVLPFALALGVLGALIVPISGILFSLPLLIGSFALIAARESRECRLLLQENG